MTRTLLILAVLIVSSVGVARAEGPASGLKYTPPSVAGTPDPGHLLLRLVGLTVVLLVVCGVVIWLARRANRLPVASDNAAGLLRHEGSIALDRRSAVHLISVEGQTAAVTTDAAGLRSIVLLSEPFEQVLEESTSSSADAVPKAA